MNHGSLFSGIGGFDLAAEWSGFTNIFNCEWEEFPRKVLKHHFPNAEQFGDIKEFDATTYSGRIDILSGGFPCQPFSVAGKRKGSEDERHLWPEMLRVIGECQPRWVVGENVRGLVNWSDGLVFETCCSDLEALGYSVQSFIIPACATNAPHRRDRVWIVAHSDNERKERTPRRDESKSGSKGIQERNEVQQFNVSDTLRENAPNTQSNGNQRNMGATQKQGEKPKRKESRGKFERNHQRNASDTRSLRPSEPMADGKLEGQRSSKRNQRQTWDSFPTQPPLCGGDDGLPQRLDGITFSKWRRESIKGYGNAIVPQVAHRIFESIKDYEKRKKSPPPCEELSSHHGER